jgi:heat shock protein HslJ
MMSMQGAIRWAIGVIFAATAFAGVGAGTALAGEEEALFGPRYHSVSVTKDGQPKPLVEGTKLWVKFTHGDFQDSVTWRAGCNFFGAPVRVNEETLNVRRIGSTDMACIGDGRMRQDRFFANFFGSDPAWTAAGRRATLSNDRVVIELRRRAAGTERG